MTNDGERGQVTPLILVVIVFAALVAIGITHLGGAVGRRASAQAAADATALAGARHGEPGAEAMAEANDADLVRFERVGDDAVVVVERRGVEAVARAGWRPVPIP